jgi:hypothetical protein
VSAPVDREQLRRDLSDALKAIQRDQDVTGLEALAASLTTLEEQPYAFHGRLLQRNLAAIPRPYSALMWSLVSGDREARERASMSIDHGGLKEQISTALRQIDQHHTGPDVSKIVEDLKKADPSSLSFHADEIQSYARAGDLRALRSELAIVWDRLEHGLAP